MEYNVSLEDGKDIYGENSLSLILKQVQPNSTILEFGPAYGRMTRYLSEVLHCSVCCIEINEKAKETLEKYSQRVIISDIEKYEWKTSLSDLSFDYIIFADVLEHLRNPERVLREASFFLKNSGRIFISVPNIAHNAIIKSLYLNLFQYSEDGILDKTHLRFFTKYSLEEMIHATGLYIYSQYATYYTDSMTQILQNENNIDLELEKKLNQRKYAHIYQFIYCVGKLPNNNEVISKLDEKERIHTLKIYYDIGDGFSETNVIESKYAMEKNICLQIQIPVNKKVKSLRIDPLESSCICVLNNIFALDGNKDKIELSVSIPMDGLSFSHENKYLFTSNDPQFIVSDINKPITSIIIDFEIVYSDFSDSEAFKIIKSILKNKTYLYIKAKEEEAQISCNFIQHEMEMRGLKIAELEMLLSKKISESDERGRELSIVQEQVLEKNAELKARAEKIADLESQLTQLYNESHERGNVLSEIKELNREISLESEERGEKIAELESQLEFVKKESLERAQKIEEIKVNLKKAQLRSAAIMKENKELCKLLNDILQRNYELTTQYNEVVDVLSSTRKKLFDKNRCLLKLEDKTFYNALKEIHNE